MKFAWYSSLSSGAKRAFKRGNGNYRKYVVSDGFIAVKSVSGKLDFVKVIRNNKKNIIAQE